jgi:Domain of unknown function (DUF4436)
MNDNPTAIQRRTIAWAAGALALLSAYFAIGLLVIHREEGPAELSLAPQQGTGAPLLIYIEILNIDPVRDALEVRLDFARQHARFGAQFAAAADRDTVLEVGDDDSEQRIAWRAGQSMASLPLTASIQTGDIQNFPFDRYTAALRLAAFEGTDVASGAPVPVRIKLWKRLITWNIKTTVVASETDPATVTLAFEVARSELQVIFAVTIYCAMALMALVSLTSSSLLFLGIRPMDTTLAAVLAAMVFTLPGLRSLMPGNPPLGVHGDHLVFFWSEISVVIGLALIVGTWAIGANDK